jgi:hypothetical protein
MIPTGWAEAGAATAAGAAAIAAAAAPAANSVVMYFGRIRMAALLRLPGWPCLASLSNNDQRPVRSNPSPDRAQETHIRLAPINSRRGGNTFKLHSDRRERPALNLETVILTWLFCGAVAAAIAHTKNRSVGEGFLWGRC